MIQKPIVKKPAKTASQKAADERLQRLIRQDRAERAQLKHVKINFMENRFGPLMFALLLVGLGTFFIFSR